MPHLIIESAQGFISLLWTKLFPQLDPKIFKYYSTTWLCQLINKQILGLKSCESAASVTSSQEYWKLASLLSPSILSTRPAVSLFVTLERTAFILLRILSSPALFLLLTLCAVGSSLFDIFSPFAKHGKTMMRNEVNKTFLATDVIPSDKNNNNNNNDKSKNSNSDCSKNNNNNKSGDVENSLVRRIQSVSVPKSYFTHMYILGSSLSCISLYSTTQLFNISFDSSILLVMLLFQTTRRLFECLFMSSFGSSRMHVFGYSVGLLHYVAVCASFTVETLALHDAPPLPVSQPSPNLNFSNHASADVDHKAMKDKILRASAIMLFIISSIAQMVHSRALFIMKTRKISENISEDSTGICKSSNQTSNDPNIHNSSSNSSSGSHDFISTKGSYDLPSYLLFKYVACPHYFFEILIYFSFIIIQFNQQKAYNCSSFSLSQTCIADGDLLNNSIRVVSIFIWVFTNQAVVSSAQYHWYIQNRPLDVAKRSNYKRLIPFVW